MFEKVLIANRGEIALRIHRACREMGIKTVAVHSTADAQAMNVRLADETVCIGPPPARASYLNIPAILSAATITGADAIHPGLGFLAENADFAEAVEEHGFTFIGPSPEHIRLMGDKVRAKAEAMRLGIPIVPGSPEAVRDIAEAEAAARAIGYPVLLKAAAGGGGRGMKLARDAAELAQMLPLAQAEARAAFGDDAVYLERFLDRPRHIEVQLLGDGQGGVVHLGERDCSLQRAHQKLLEETPSPALDPPARERLLELAVAALEELGYRSAGTIEFLYQDGAFYFIEMNTRLQVEHPISEMVSGVDIVREQLRIAAGAPLGYRQSDIALRGHAIECRINAESAEDFRPSPGRVSEYHAPGGLGVRVDSALYQGYEVPPYYDSLIAKLVVHGADPRGMPDAAAPGARGICDRRHRDDDPVAPAPRRQSRIPPRRLRHPLARALPRAAADAMRRGDPADPRHPAPGLCRRHLPDGRIGRRPGAVLGRPDAPRHPAARCVPRAAPLAARACAAAASRCASTPPSRRSCAGCAEASETRPTTWINAEIVRLYSALFERGAAHSVECWHERRAGRRALRRLARRRVLRREHVQPGHRREQGRARRISSRGCGAAAIGCSTPSS